MYRVTLIEGSNDICFIVPDHVGLGVFLRDIFKWYSPREIEEGIADLTVEVEYVERLEDDF